MCALYINFDKLKNESSGENNSFKMCLESKVEVLRYIQGNIQDINSILATPDKTSKNVPCFHDVHTVFLEREIDAMERVNPKLTKFILQGITPLDAQSHMCRIQARKVERMLWKLNKDTDIDINILKYMNRLSDFFFVFSRWVCSVNGITDIYKI
jgi:cob(I)alamin adenosyltransferase